MEDGHLGTVGSPSVVHAGARAAWRMKLWAHHSPPGGTASLHPQCPQGGHQDSCCLRWNRKHRLPGGVGQACDVTAYSARQLEALHQRSVSTPALSYQCSLRPRTDSELGVIGFMSQTREQRSRKVS